MLKVMFRLSLMLLFCSINILNAQALVENNQTLLVFAEDNDFLLPHVIEMLSDIKDVKTGKRIFGKVINLNRYKDDIQYQLTFSEVFHYFSSESKLLEDSKDAVNLKKQITDGLTDHNLFLKIKINSLNELLEYQCSLFKVLKNETQNSNSFPIIDVNSPISDISFFIDPRSHDYESTLNNHIIRLFPQTNSPPISKIRINNTYRSNTIQYFAVGDTLLIDGLASLDIDTSRNKLQYFWSQIDPRGNLNVNLDELIDLDPFAEKQEIVVKNPGVYFIGLRVYDGITISEQDTLFMQIIEKPLLIPDYDLHFRMQSRTNIYNFFFIKI